MTHNQHSSGKRILFIAAVVVLALALAGCQETGQMIDQPRYDPMEASALFADGKSARDLVPGTVPYMEEGSPNDPALTGLDESGAPLEGFPTTVDAELLAVGQERYTIFCTPCHGPTGEGNGKVTGFGFPKPPSLLGDEAIALTNADMFRIITEGQGNMFPYAYRVKPPERWAVIAYVRAMQLKNGQVNTADLTPEEIEQIGSQK